MIGLRPGALVVVLMGSLVACAQIAGLSTHASVSDGGAGEDVNGGAAGVGAGADAAVSASPAGADASGAGADTSGGAGPTGADASGAPSPDGAVVVSGADAAASGTGADGAAADAPVVSVAPGPMCGGPDAASCPTGLGDCRGTGCNVDLGSDPENCGTCGESCHGGECRDGACVAVALARDQKFQQRRQVAVGPSGVTWGTTDGFIWRLPFAAGAQPIKLAEGEGTVEDIVVDDQFAYIESQGGHCPTDWCLRRISLVPGQFPSSSLGTISPPATYMALGSDALYYEANTFVYRLPLRGPGLPTPIMLAHYQPNMSTFGIAVDRDHVYWGASEGGGTVRRIRIDGSEKDPQEIVRGSTDVIWSVAVDETNVYWTTGKDRAIRTTRKEGGGPVITLATDEEETYALAIDDLNVYWGDQYSASMKKVPKCGGEVRVVARGNGVFGVVPWMGYVYFNDSVSGLFRVAR